jgi:nucleoid DNA-binding protein
MNKEDLVRTLAERNPKMTKKDIALVVDEFFAIISEALKRGEEVQLGDFGTFSLADKTMKSILRRK